MSRKQIATVGLAATLGMLALATAAVAMALPSSAAGAGNAEPVIRSVRDTGDAFVVRWGIPEGVTPQEQTVEAWTDDGYRRMSIIRISVLDDVRQAEVQIARTDESGTAYGFSISMLSDGERIVSKPRYLFPHGRMAKQPPSGLEALWHNEELHLRWTPGWNNNYVGQVAKCRTQERVSTWETVELGRRNRMTVFADLDADAGYVCRVEARKANGHSQMTGAVNANRRRIETPASVRLEQVERGSDDVRFSWSLGGTEGVSKLLVQREGPLPNDYSPVYPGWKTLAELEPDATSYVDTVAVEPEVVFYYYRVVAVAERGGSTVGSLGVCRLEQDGEDQHHDCGLATAYFH